MAGYTEVELRALDAADKAFAEVRKVAQEFARQIDGSYHRMSNTWFSTSCFMTRYGGNRWSTVSDLYDGWNNEACECAWELERTWNERIGTLKDKYDHHIMEMVLTDSWHEHEHHSRRCDEILDARQMLLEEMGSVVESWYESATDMAWEDYLAEHAA